MIRCCSERAKSLAGSHGTKEHKLGSQACTVGTPSTLVLRASRFPPAPSPGAREAQPHKRSCGKVREQRGCARVSESPRVTGVTVTPLPAGEAQPRGPARLSVPRPATPTPRLPQAGAARGGPGWGSRTCRGRHGKPDRPRRRRQLLSSASSP